MLIRVIDFETTGFPPNAGVCEIAFTDVWDADREERKVGSTQAQLCNPGLPIEIQARAVHHISDADIASALPTDEVMAYLSGTGVDAYCAHNAKFEKEFFDGNGKPWICTHKVALRLWPEAPKHDNQTLRYYLGLELDPALAMPPHRAGPDAYVTAHILMKALEERTIEDLIDYSSKPGLLTMVSFGKHKGKKWSEVPRDYLEWLLRQGDMNEDARFTAEHHLNGGQS